MTSDQNLPEGEQTNQIKDDFMASIVVFLVALPLCMGIALASGVPVAAGLITGIIGGLVVGTISGCPLQVSGPAAGLTVIIIDVVQSFGLETLGIIVLLAGVIQGIAGILKLGQWFRAVSPAVIKGMLAGIGVLILGSQFHVMVDDKPKHSGIENLVTIPSAIAKGLQFPEFKSYDSRKFQKLMLQRVGELHRRQVEIEEGVGEVFPHIHDPEIEFTEARREAAHSKLEVLAELQKEVNEELEKVVSELVQTADQHIIDLERLERIKAAAELSIEQNRLALTSLNNEDPETALSHQDDAAEKLQAFLGTLKNHHLAAHLGLLAIISIIGWQFVPQKLKIIPGPLIAVIVPTIIAAALALPVFYVEIPDRLWDGIHFPSLAVIQDSDFRVLIQTAFLIAIVASAETLLCATAVDQMHHGQRTNYDKELFAQGVGNSICGFLGVLPMTGVIVRSSANIQAGGRTRLSAILHGVWLLVFIVALGFLLRQIPTACLAAILVYTGYKLVDIKAIKNLAKYGKSEVAIYFATVITIVCTDLLIGVSVGIGLAAVKLLHNFSTLDAELVIDQETKRATLTLSGAATFLRLPVIAAELDRVPRQTELHVDLQYLNYVDHACLELLMTWASQHEQTGGRLVIDWDSLHARFYSGGKPTPAAVGMHAAATAGLDPGTQSNDPVEAEEKPDSESAS